MATTWQSKPIELVGQACNKWEKKHGWGAYKGSPFYLIEVKLDAPPALFPGHIRVVKDKLGAKSEDIWESVLTSSFYGKRFLFTCYKRGLTWTLYDWRELGKEIPPDQWKKAGQKKITHSQIEKWKKELPSFKHEKNSKDKKDEDLLF